MSTAPATPLGPNTGAHCRLHGQLTDDHCDHAASPLTRAGRGSCNPRGMGELVAFSDDIEQMGRAFGNAALDIGEVLTQLQRVSDHVHRAFHNHPDHAGAAVAPLMQLHGTIAQLEELASALAVTLVDVARAYDANDATVASTWEQSGMERSQPGGR